MITMKCVLYWINWHLIGLSFVKNWQENMNIYTNINTTTNNININTYMLDLVTRIETVQFVDRPCIPVFRSDTLSPSSWLKPFLPGRWRQHVTLKRWCTLKHYTTQKPRRPQTELCRKPQIFHRNCSTFLPYILYPEDCCLLGCSTV
jgi:hypothetical protein